jgi:hypothetical protein
LHTGVVQVLPSLLAFDPAAYGLPPLGDLVEGVIPLDPVFTISGNVVKGFGRGSKVCGGKSSHTYKHLHEVCGSFVGVTIVFYHQWHLDSGAAAEGVF